MSDGLILISHGANPESVKGRGKDFSFVCFIDDYLERRRWEDALSPYFRKVPLKAALEKNKRDLRDPFIDWVESLGRGDEELWPLISVAEENTFVSNLFLDCIRLKTIDDLLSQGEKKLIVIIDDPYLLEAVKHLARKRGLKTQTIRSWKDYSKKLKVKLTPLFHLTKFLVTSVKQRQAVRDIKKTIPQQKKGSNIILHTWIDDGALTQDGKYRDRYFGNLIDWLIQKEENLFIVPYIYNTRRSFREVYKLLTESGYNFIIPQQYYHFADYLKGVRRAFKILSLSRKRAIFSAIDLTKLIKRETYRQTLGQINFFMYLDLFLRLKENRFHFDAAIDVFEGMIPERAWIMGFSRAYPEGKTIGYQHTLFSRDLLCYFVYRGRSLTRVIPQKVVCTGEMVKKLLIREGLPESRLFTGCALRYEYLWKKGPANSVKTFASIKETPRLLVGLPLQLSGASELLAIASNIAKRRKDLEFFIKPHPMMNRGTLKNILQVVSWPRDETSIAEGSMEEWVKKADVVISTASASVVDAMVVGKPVVIVGREGVLDLNPLDWIESPYTATYCGEAEIERRIDEILSKIGEEEEKESLLSIGQKILTGCFNPVTEENLQAFLSS